MRIPLFMLSLLVCAILPGGHRISFPESPVTAWHDLHLSHIRPEEARRVFDQLLPESVVEVTHNGLSLFATSSEHARAVEILREIDLPSMTPQTRFIRIHHAKAEDVAGLLRLILKSTKSESGFEAIADPRTNRIFMMGGTKRQAIAEAIINLVDR